MSELEESSALQIRGDDIIVVLGKRRSGKSNLIAYLIQTLHLDFVILDVVGNLRFLKDQSNVVYYSVDPDNEEQLNQILRASAGKTIIVDEADLYSWNRHNFLNRILQIGRNYGIGFWVSARRPANLSKNLLSNCDLALIFSYREPRDVEYLDSWLASGIDYTIKEPFTFRVFVQGEDRGLYKVEKAL